MNSLYEVFNITSDMQFDNLLNQMNLSVEELIQLESISSNRYYTLNEKRQMILEMLSSPDELNYNIALKFFNSNKERKLKENVNMNVVLELNDLIELTYSKCNNNNSCAKELYQMISKSCEKSVADAFFMMVRNSANTDDNLKFDTELVVNGKNVSECIKSIKNNIINYLNSIEQPKKESTTDKENLEECDLSNIVSNVCEEDTFNGLVDNIETPTIINITINKEENNEEMDKEQLINSLKSLITHIDDEKDCCEENNLENLETIDTLIGSISNYFHDKLTEGTHYESITQPWTQLQFILSNEEKGSNLSIKAQEIYRDMEDGAIDEATARQRLGNISLLVQNKIEKMDNTIKETCSAGATCAASVATVSAPIKTKKKRKLKYTESLFLDMIKENKNAVQIIDGNTYKLKDGYFYKNDVLVKTKNNEEMVEYVLGNIELPLLEGMLPFHLDLLLEDNMNDMSNDEDLTPEQRTLKAQQETNLEDQINSNSSVKVSVTDEQNPNEIETDQELIGVDDSDENNKKFIVKNPMNNEMKVVDANNINTQQ